MAGRAAAFLAALLLAIAPRPSAPLRAAEKKAEAPTLEKVLDRALEPAVKKLPAGARILLILTEDPGNDKDSWRVAGLLRDEAARALEARGFKAIVSPDVEAQVAKWQADPARDKKPLDAKALAAMAPSDAIFDIKYSRRGARRTLTLGLVEAPKMRRIWGKAVAVPDAVVAMDSRIPELNRKVVDFAASKKGTKVGDGECWTLAAEALKQAGARMDGAYGFGRELGPRDPIFPGDVIQFEKARFISGAHMPHHTAIVQEVLGPETVVILHQNFGDDGKKVSALPLNFRDLREGTLQVFRPRS